MHVVLKCIVARYVRGLRSYSDDSVMVSCLTLTCGASAWSAVLKVALSVV